MPVPQFPEIEKKEKKRLDTTKLDEAFSLSRYLEKHGLDKKKKKKTKRKASFNQKI